MTYQRCSYNGRFDIRSTVPQWAVASFCSLQRDATRSLVVAVARPAFGENAVARDPVDGLGVGVLSVRLEDQAFAGAPAAGVHQRVEALGEFVLVVMRVTVGAGLDVVLQESISAEEFAQVFGVGVAVDHRRDHEGRVDDFAEAELLGEVIGAAEQGRPPGLGGRPASPGGGTAGPRRMTS